MCSGLRVICCHDYRHIHFFFLSSSFFLLLLVSAVPCLFHVWFLLVYSNRQPDEAEDVIFPPHTQTYKHYGTPTHTHTVLKRETCLPGFIPGWHRRSFSFFPIVIFFLRFFFGVCVLGDSVFPWHRRRFCQSEPPRKTLIILPTVCIFREKFCWLLL